MLVDKDKRLKRKASMDNHGNPRHCRICNKNITTKDIESDNFEYVKNKIYGENFFHSRCVKKEVKNK